MVLFLVRYRGRQGRVPVLGKQDRSLPVGSVLDEQVVWVLVVPELAAQAEWVLAVPAGSVLAALVRSVPAVSVLAVPVGSVLGVEVLELGLELVPVPGLELVLVPELVPVPEPAEVHHILTRLRMDRDGTQNRCLH